MQGASAATRGPLSRDVSGPASNLFWVGPSAQANTDMQHADTVGSCGSEDRIQCELVNAATGITGKSVELDVDECMLVWMFLVRPPGAFVTVSATIGA